jgi:hypothetical protein
MYSAIRAWIHVFMTEIMLLERDSRCADPGLAVIAALLPVSLSVPAGLELRTVIFYGTLT